MAAWFRKLRTKLWQLWRASHGYSECSHCGNWTVYWVKIPLLFADEPPMLCQWKCEACGAETEITGTPLSDQAAHELGYPDFMTALEAKLQREGSK